MTNTVNILYRETTTPNLPSVSSAKQAPLTNREIDGNFKSIANAIETIGTNVNQVQNWIKVEGSYEPDPNTAYYNKPVSNFTGVIQHNGNELLNTQNWVTHLTSGSEKVLTTSNWGTHLKHGSEVVLTSGNWHSHVSNNFMMGGQHSFSKTEVKEKFVKSAMEYCANLVAPGITPTESLLIIFTRILSRQIPDDKMDLNTCSIYFDDFDEGDKIRFKNLLKVQSHTIVPNEHKLESSQIDVFFTDEKLNNAISHAQQFLYGECAASSNSISGVVLTSENWRQYFSDFYIPEVLTEEFISEEYAKAFIYRLSEFSDNLMKEQSDVAIKILARQVFNFNESTCSIEYNESIFEIVSTSITYFLTPENERINDGPAAYTSDQIQQAHDYAQTCIEEYCRGGRPITFSQNEHMTKYTSTINLSDFGVFVNASNNAAIPFIFDDTNPNALVYDLSNFFYNPDTLTLTVGSVTEASDQRLKTNIEPLQGSLDNVISLEGVSFDWKKNGEPSIGVIAQQIESFYPQLISEDDKGMKSVNYSGLVGVLIEAMKEQQGMINELRSEVEKLKG